jgi:carboxylesterase type B
MLPPDVLHAFNLETNSPSLEMTMKTGSYSLIAAFSEPKLNNNHSLYLNVWAPPNATSSSNYPVKVWIYGGGEQGGGIQNPEYDGCNLAVNNALVVGISYRLGPLGFLTLASAGIGGNFGIQDLLLGLEWVQANIAAFGGNPVCFSLPSLSLKRRY